jgi:uncharacterized protein with HEPN domain
MKKALRIPDYLGHIVEAIERIQRYTANVTEQAFLNNELIQDAVARNIEIIGEAAKNIQRVDPDFASKHEEIPWQVMYAMRNRLSHGYDTIDYEIVWNLVQEDMKNLHGLIKSALN